MKNKLVISGVLCIVIISLVILYLVREKPKIKETPITDTSSIEPVGYSIKRKPGDSVVFTCVQYRDNYQNNKFIVVQLNFFKDKVKMSYKNMELVYASSTFGNTYKSLDGSLVFNDMMYNSYITENDKITIDGCNSYPDR